MNRKRGATLQHGFTTMQMVVTVAIISVISVFGVLGITNARAEFRMQSSARLFASYVEKARVDSIRRHAPEGEESSIETFGQGTDRYEVTMDFGTGALETRTFYLESGLTFETTAKKVTFDWRGRISEAWVFQIFSSYLDRGLPVDVSGSGDITVGEQHFPDQLIPPVEVTQVTGDVDYDPTPTPTAEATPPIEDPGGGDGTDPVDTPSPSPSPSPTGNGNGNGNGSDNGNNGNGGDNGNNGNGNPQASPTPSPSPSPTASPESTPIPQCVSTISPNTLSLSQSNTAKQSGSATFTMTNATGVRTISAQLAGHGNSLNIAVGLQRIDGSGSSVITISTKNGGGNRGEFIVEVSASPGCGSTQQLRVSVSN